MTLDPRRAWPARRPGGESLFRYAWAKSLRPDDSAMGSLAGPHWLPLHVHLTDTAEIAGRLCHEWLGPGPLGVIAQDVGGLRDAREIVRLAAATHDLGKLTPAFAVQVDELRYHMQDNGFRFGHLAPAHSKELRHAVAGHLLVHRILIEAGANNDTADRFAGIVGGHHGVPPTPSQLLAARNRKELFGTDEWDEARHQLLGYLLDTTGLHDAVGIAASRPLSDAAQILITGLVIMADWIASSGDLFPLVPHFQQVVADPQQRAADAWQKLSLPQRWCPEVSADTVDPNELLRNRFPRLKDSTANQVQALAVESALAMTEPGLLIIEAMMGVGKTEASLLAAEVLAAKFGMSGVFYGLPTRATADAMFQRITRWLEQVPDTSGSPVKSLVLRHGTATLNPDFETIPRQWLGRDSLFDDAELTSVGIDELPKPAELGGQPIEAVVHSWTSVRKRASLADFTVATIDHELMAALAARHFVLRHLGLARQVVVLDEIHAADTWMRVFLLRALEWLGRLRVPVIALSATLPPDLRTALIHAYEHGRRAGLPPVLASTISPVLARGKFRPTGNRTLPRDMSPLPHPPASDDYPLLTTLSAGECTQRSAGTHTRPIDVSLRWLTETANDPSKAIQALADLLQTELADGGCALVVCNTVARATERYRVLTDLLPMKRITLAHSRFIAADRIRNDSALRTDFGPPPREAAARAFSESSRDNRIVITTQVAEQSLDVDFDLLITDLAPIDLILQRMGRMHRHQRGNARPARLRIPRCWITAFDPEHGAVVDQGGKKVYGESPLLRSAALLLEHTTGEPIRLPGDIPSLVRRAYSDDPIGPDDWQDTMLAVAQHDDAENRKTANNAATGTIRAPGSRPQSLIGWLPDTGPNSEADAARQVRQDDGGFEVLLLEQADDGVRLPHHLETETPIRIPTDTRPDRATARQIARCAVRVPGWVTDRHLTEVIDALNQNYFREWQREPLLAGQWVLLLDHDGHGRLGPLHVNYDATTGLEVTDGRATDKQR